MFCNKCGAGNADNAEFCSGCGAGLQVESVGVKRTVVPRAPGPSVADSVGAMPTMAPEMGEKDVLRGKYEIQRELGRGGMGIVYLAHDRDLPDTSPAHRVAIKMLPPTLGRDQRWMTQLTREFDTAFVLRGDHVVRVFSFAKDDRTGSPFIVMEYVDGTSLDAILVSKGKLSEEDTITLAQALARGLHEAHERGLVHRDFKPGNVLVPYAGGFGAAKVADFGLARTVQSGMSQMTGQAGQSGTLMYNSPEQFRGSRRLDARSDQYSLGAALYECLAGYPLVNPEGDIGWQVTREEPEPIEGVSEGYTAALRRALAKAPADRFGSVIEFVDSLRNEEPIAVPAAPDPEQEPKPAAAPREKPTASKESSMVAPAGWTSETRRVSVATPEGGQEREIGYYRNSLGMEFVLIPSGEFMMGSPDDEEGRFGNEGRVHKVRITKPFFLGAYEVTQAQWQAVMGNNPSDFRGNDRPVEEVSWNDCQEFVSKLCAKEGAARKSYRLPTEAEWEYACRAGSRTRFYGGDDDSDLGKIGWYGGNSGGETHDVGQKAPNAFGLYDMSGNVWEWCQDWFDSGYYGKSSRADPKGPGSAGYRVLRGGSWVNNSRDCRSAVRDGDGPASAYNLSGFRVVVVSSSPEE